ncbi:MAG: SprT family zinc-dependent metalloprotease [Candidatus Hadarchaeales archaeon]
MEWRRVRYPRLEFKTGSLLVILPPRLRSETPLLEKKKAWIMEKYETIKEALEEAGEGLRIFGEPFQVRAPEDGWVGINFETKEVFCNIGDPKQIRRLEVILRRRLEKELEKRIEKFGKMLGVPTPRFSIRKQRSKWASCSKSGNLSFNLRLITLPPRMLDYMVWHELLHLKYSRHCQEFWREVSKIFPDYPQAEKNLLRFWFSSSRNDWLFSPPRNDASSSANRCASAGSG